MSTHTTAGFAEAAWESSSGPKPRCSGTGYLQERDGDESSCSSEEEGVSTLQEAVNAKMRFGRIRAGIDSWLTRTRTWPGTEGQTGCFEAPFPKSAFLALSAWHLCP